MCTTAEDLHLRLKEDLQVCYNRAAHQCRSANCRMIFAACM